MLKGDIQPAIELHEMLYQVMQRHKFLPEVSILCLPIYLACWVKFSVEDILNLFFKFFFRKQVLTFHANCLQWRNHKENISLSSAVFAQREVKITVFIVIDMCIRTTNRFFLLLILNEALSFTNF